MERLGLVSVLGVQRLGLESLKKWNVSVSVLKVDHLGLVTLHLVDIPVL